LAGDGQFIDSVELQAQFLYTVETFGDSPSSERFETSRILRPLVLTKTEQFSLGQRTARQPAAREHSAHRHAMPFSAAGSTYTPPSQFPGDLSQRGDPSAS
jgi:hypothetical protein